MVDTLASETLKKDKIFAPLVEKYAPIPLDNAGSVFGELIRNIVFQQISYKAAQAIFQRYIMLFEDKLYTPHVVLNMDDTLLRNVGLSNMKVRYVKNIASFFIEKDLINFDWSNMTDSEIINLLTQIKGVGIWTVKMILIFELQRPDVLAFEDLAVRDCIKDLYQLKVEKKELVKKISKIAETWRPYRSLACLYLWAHRRALLQKK